MGERNATISMRVLVRKTFIALFLAFFLAVGAGNAQTTDILQSYRVDMPDVQPYSAEQLKDLAYEYEDTPFKDKALSYKMVVPKGWENQLKSDFGEENMSSKVMGELARFYSPPRVITERSFITVQAINLGYEMSAEHWVLRYLLSRGLTPKGMKKINRSRTEFFFVDVKGDTTFGVHSVAQINGKRALLVQYYLPIQAWDEEKQMQTSVIQSFVALNPVEEDVEPMMEYRFLDVARLKYPQSWKLKASTIRTIDQMKIQILNFNENATEFKPTLDGKVEVFLNSYFAVESMAEEKKKLIAELAQNNLILGEQIDSKEDRLDNYFKNHEDFASYDVEVYRASSSQSKLLGYEYWITSLESGDYFYFFTLLTPSRNDDFFIWSRNKETYELIMKSFEPDLEGLYDE